MSANLTNNGTLVATHNETAGLVIHQPIEFIGITLITLLTLIMIAISIPVLLEIIGIPILDWVEKSAKYLSDPRKLKYDITTKIREILYPNGYLEKREKEETFLKEVRNSVFFHPERIKNIEELVILGDSDGFEDRHIVKLGDTYKTLKKHDYKIHDYIYLDKGRVRGRYIPIKRVHPDNPEPAHVEHVLRKYGGTRRCKVITSHGRHITSKEVYNLIQAEDAIVIADGEIIGILEQKPKW